MGDSKFIFVIVPSFNEAKVIRSTVQSLINKEYSIVVVDDCSTDDTKQQLAGMPVIYIRHKINLGQGAALQTGFRVAIAKNATFIVTFDADGQHDVNDIERMLGSLKEKNLDIVLGSRFLPGAHGNISNGRKFVLKIACFMNYLFTGIMLSDAHNGLRVLNKYAAESIHLKENRMAHASEILKEIKRNNLKFDEYPVNILYTKYSRKKGQSLLNSIRIFFELLMNKIFD